jgi:hypothetical protein
VRKVVHVAWIVCDSPAFDVFSGFHRPRRLVHRRQLGISSTWDGPGTQWSRRRVKKGVSARRNELEAECGDAPPGWTRPGRVGPGRIRRRDDRACREGSFLVAGACPPGVAIWDRPSVRAPQFKGSRKTCFSEARPILDRASEKRLRLVVESVRLYKIVVLLTPISYAFLTACRACVISLESGSWEPLR